MSMKRIEPKIVTGESEEASAEEVAADSEDESQFEEDEEMLETEEQKQKGKPMSSKRTKTGERIKQKRRFVAFTSPERIGVVDTETNEVISEGPLAILQALADIVERLERIEVNLGNLVTSGSE